MRAKNVQHRLGTFMAILLFVLVTLPYKVLLDFRGKLRDTILDWEDALPPAQLDKAEKHCRQVQRSVPLAY